MPETTIENKKILLTNRMAVVIVASIISGTFAFTTFYHQSRIQDIVTAQNKEKIEGMEKLIEKIEDDTKARLAMMAAEMNAKEQAMKLYADQLVKQEVGGLRGDWERKNAEQRDLHARHEKQIDNNRELILDRHSKEK